MGANTSPLLEREAELGVLGEALTAACVGEGSAVALSGPAGIGKTRLLAAFRSEAEGRGALVVRGRATDLERTFAFGVIRGLLEPVLRRSSASERDGLLGGAAAPAAVVLGLGDDPAAAVDVSPALLNALYWTVAGLADRRPLVLVVDDLQWADAPSLRALAFIANRSDSLSLLLVTGTRDAEVSDDEAALGAVRKASRPLVLSGLSVGAVATLLGADPDDESVRTAHGATGGNPFWVLQAGAALANTPADGGALPVSVLSAIVLARLGTLGSAARAVAAAVAVLGVDAQLDPVASLADLSRDEVLIAADELARSKLFASEQRLSFAHPLVAEAVLHDLGTHVVAREHARAATLLSLAGVPVENVAGHLLLTLATGSGSAVGDLLAAARSALQRGDVHVADRYLARARADGPAGGLAAALEMLSGIVAFRANRFEEARDRLLPMIGEPGIDLGVLAAAATAAIYTFQDGGPAAPFLAAAERQQDFEHRSLLLAFAAFYSNFLGAGVSHPGLRDPGAIAGESTADLIELAAWCIAPGLPLPQAANLAVRALGDGALLSAHPALTTVGGVGFQVLLTAGRFEDVDRELPHLAEQARLSATRSAVQIAEVVALLADHARGRLPVAVTRAERLFRAIREFGADWTHRLVLASSISIDVVRMHDGPAAAAALVDDITFGGQQELQMLQASTGTWFAGARTLLALDLHDTAQAQIWAARFMEWNQATGVFPVPAGLAVGPILALVRAGDRSTAHEFAERQLGLERRRGVPERIAGALRGLAHAQPDDAYELLEEAVTLYSPGVTLVEEALGYHDLGNVLRRHNRRRDARAAQEHAATLASQAQARCLLAAVRDQLEILGAKPRRWAFSGLESLTASERRTADLAAAGLTNREIAEQLFVTRKTVEGHLAHAYRKLAISSREELAQAMDVTGAGLD